MKIIIGLSDQNHDCKRMRYRNWIGAQLSFRGMGHIRPEWESLSGFVHAAVSKGRWYIKCPGSDCGSSIAIDEGETGHFCIDCLNIENDFKPHQVIWPSFKGIERLNKILGRRPDYRRRNWLPHLGETMEHLMAENRKYGWDE